MNTITLPPPPAMHDRTCEAYAEEMRELALRIAALPHGPRQIIARLLKSDLDLLSSAAVDAALLHAALRTGTPVLAGRAECVHIVLAHAIRTRIETLGPLAFDAPPPP